MSEYVETTLGAISKGKGEYGIAASAVEYSPELYTYLRITDIYDDGTINKPDLKSLDDPNASKYLLKPNDLVIARTGASTGRSYFYDSRDGEFVYAGFLIKFSLDPDKVFPPYVKYHCLSPAYRGWISQTATGSTRGNINAVMLASMPISLPPIEQQKKVVAVLQALDDKVELNRAMNMSLAATACALFKSWFVNFDPFGGVMPTSWQDGVIGAILKEQPKSAHNAGDAKDVKGPYPFFTSGSKTMEFAEAMVDGENIYLNDGGVADVKFYIGKAAYSSHTWCVTGKNNFTYYLLLLLKSMHASGELDDQFFTGTALKNLRKKDLKARACAIPPPDVVDRFNVEVGPLIERMSLNDKMNKTLAQLRDTLLPKLMSGEINVDDVKIDCG